MFYIEDENIDKGFLYIPEITNKNLVKKDLPLQTVNNNNNKFKKKQ